MVFASVHVLEQASLAGLFLGVPGGLPQHFLVLPEVVEVGALHPACGPGETKVDHLVAQAHNLE